MRLSLTEKQSITKVIRFFDQDARIYLFGSRVNDRQKGGDIDLLVLSQRLSAKDTPKILGKLFEDLEEQKIDLIMTKTLANAFERLIYQESVEL